MRLDAVIGACSIAAIAASVSAADLRLQLGERAGVDDHLLHRGDLVVVEVGGADTVEHGSLRRRRRGDGAGQQRRGLALAEIAADRLAGDLLVAERAHHVVAHLERVAERQAVGAERGQQLGGASGAASTAPRCSGRSTVYLPLL